MHLLRVRSPALAGRYHCHLPDLYGAGPGMVTTCHVPICGREGGKKEWQPHSNDEGRVTYSTASLH